MISPESVEPQQVDITPTSSVTEIVPIPQTRTSLVRQVAGLRDQVQAISSDVTHLHRKVNASDLDRRTNFKVRDGVEALLEQLANERGVSWSDLAQMLGVSVQAVRKWRKGGAPVPDHRLGLARLAAFLDLLAELKIADPVGWMEVPLVQTATIRGLDLYAAGKIDLLLEWAQMRIESAEQLLDMFDRDWRDKYHTGYETFDPGDGNLSIRRRT